ncbi:MAG: methyltransferase family protein [Allosphingosinicella sp.]|uniref:methyltransferase family protein n=1 Tax=Allosphingosinicella sp. TaxID=2823234 RepID=UPI00395FAC1E
MNAEVRIAPDLRHDPRPRSAVSAGVGFAGLSGLVAWLVFCRSVGLADPLAAMGGLLACGLPMVAWSLLVDKVHRNPTTGIDWSAPPRPIADILDISLSKIVGLWAVWGIIGCLYCIARWYWDGQYLFAMQALGLAAIPMLVLSVPYVIWLDRRLREPRDGAWQFGQLLIGRAVEVDREVLFDFFRCWTIKAFFLAFMISIVPGNFAAAVLPEAAWIAEHPINLARWLIGVMFMLDVTFATVGYVLTMKPLDAHIRSANPYAAGWAAALICYPPFILMGAGGPLNYSYGTYGEEGWIHWLGSSPLVMTLVGFWLVFLAGIYAWATIVFGIRFSNLTHRGILTHGPYAWTKHPAYVSKNIFWWFAFMPFLVTTGNPVDMIRNTATLALVSGVYYWRAKTEEKHLSADPAYREYAEWMDRNGPIPRLVNRLKPRWMRPAPPAPLPAE